MDGLPTTHGRSSNDTWTVFQRHMDSLLTTHGRSSYDTWMVFQRHMDESEKFNRPWLNYVEGFGKLYCIHGLGPHAKWVLCSPVGVV